MIGFIGATPQLLFNKPNNQIEFELNSQLFCATQKLGDCRPDWVQKIPVRATDHSKLKKAKANGTKPKA